MSKSATVIRRRRENPSRADILVIPALALALDACGGGGSQRHDAWKGLYSAPPPDLRPPIRRRAANSTSVILVIPNPGLRALALDACGGGGSQRPTQPARAVTVSDPDADDTHTSVSDTADDTGSVDERFEVADGMLKLKDGMSLDHRKIPSRR